MGKIRKKSTSRSVRSNLNFPVGRIDSTLKRRKFTERVSDATAVALAAVLEYILAETLELSGNAAKKSKRKRITPKFIQLAIRSDEDLNSIFKSGIISKGGVQPSIHSELLKPKRKLTKKQLLVKEQIEKSLKANKSET